ncbi:C2 domain-containing protein [Aphelenchoides besseyi]|nr:C2 domain-containing protein [Aphelenchoides besseyi]
MSDEIELIKPFNNDPKLLAPADRKPQTRWADDPTVVASREPTDVKIFSPPESIGGDRSPAYSEPVSAMSPSGLLSPSSDLPLMHSKSFDSSSISSKSSKRTTMSADTSLMIRQRVRQHARSLVDKKRGSVQLAKRLLRSQTLQNAEAPFNPDDFEAADRKLEYSLQLGAKYTKREQANEILEHIQQTFFHGLSTTTPDQPPISGPLVVFTKPKSTDKQRADFAALLTVHRPLNSETIEDPVQRRFLNRGGRDFRLLLSRHGDRFASAVDGVHGLGNKMVTHRIERLVREDDEDYGLVTYGAPVHWNDWISHGARPSRYFQLTVDLNQIEFDHHWLFGVEDAAARRLRSLHSDYVLLCEEAATAWHEYATIKQRLEFEIVGKEEQQRLSATMLEIGNRIDALREDLPKVASLMENAYETLEQLRTNSGIDTVDYRLERIDAEAAEDESGRPFSMVTYLLKRTHTKTENSESTARARVSRVLSQRRNAQEQLRSLDEERRKAIGKCRIRVQLYFNDIFVCKTEDVQLQADFTARFAQVYSLRVYERPEAVRLVVSERFDRNAWRDLAVVYVPFQSGMTTVTPALEPMEFASEIVISSFKNSIGCGESTRSPHLQGRVFCNAVWFEADSNWLNENEQKEAAISQTSFSLIPLETQLDADVDDDVRLQVLERRFVNRHYATRGLDLRVGLFTNELDNTFLTDEWRTDEFGASIGADSGLDALHELACQYAINVRKQLVESATSRRKTKSYNDIVREDSLPLFGFFGALFQPPDMSRKLKPMRSQQRAKSGNTRHDRCKIIVNVQSATNLPEKINGEPTNIYVDVVFRKQHAQTNTVEGRYANWQQTIILEIERDHDFDNWANVDDHFELRLYDRQLSGLDFDNREMNTIHEQIENRFLGHVLIPFSTVYAFGKVDGAMFIEKPLFYTDYKGFEKRSQLKLLITSDPLMQPPQLRLNEAFFDGGESIEITRECQKWQTRCINRFPDRLFRALVSDTNGKATLTTRYTQAITPPHLLRERATVDALRGCNFAARIVSCVPLVSHPIVSAHSTDIWMTVDQVLTIGCGSVEEHALLLATWLLGLGYNVALVLGRALPEGANAAYVLVEIDSHPTFLVDPCDAQSYFLDDPTCPLFQVGTVITPTNVYANIQPAAHPAQIEFNFTRKAHWDPLFADKRAANFSSVQKGTIVYKDVADDLVMELRTGLEREIRVKFDQSRPYGIPQWNVLASRALRELLTELNETVEEQRPANVKHKFSQLGIPYDFTALALQRAYTTKSQLVSDILSTQMHVNANPLAQFAFAVHIQPFFNNIVSCSLAIAVLTTQT